MGFISVIVGTVMERINSQFYALLLAVAFSFPVPALSGTRTIIDDFVTEITCAIELLNVTF